MSEQNNPTQYPEEYNNESWMHPGTNLAFFSWALLLGLPALLLFMLFSKHAG